MSSDNEEPGSEMRDEMREYLADLREEMVELEAQGLVQIVGEAAVAPEAFAAAAEREDAALAAYYAAKEQRDRAESALDALSCRTSFTYEVEGPYPEESDDVYVIEEECTWPAGHAGEHRGDFDESDAADPAYAQVLRKFRDAADVAGDKREQWEEAEESLDALRCNQGPAGEWPCILRRGHDAEHEHPTELHLVG